MGAYIQPVHNAVQVKQVTADGQTENVYVAVGIAKNLLVTNRANEAAVAATGIPRANDAVGAATGIIRAHGSYD
jgi:4-hydroxy-3-methylbut-2-enyl diphosphate reductase IspH